VNNSHLKYIHLLKTDAIFSKYNLHLHSVITQKHDPNLSYIIIHICITYIWNLNYFQLSWQYNTKPTWQDFRFLRPSIKMTGFWDVVLCSLAEDYRRFRGACCLHNQGDESYVGKLLPGYTAQHPRRESFSSQTCFYYRLYITVFVTSWKSSTHVLTYTIVMSWSYDHIYLLQNKIVSLFCQLNTWWKTGSNGLPVWLGSWYHEQGTKNVSSAIRNACVSGNWWQISSIKVCVDVLGFIKLTKVESVDSPWRLHISPKSILCDLAYFYKFNVHLLLSKRKIVPGA
jgi:hypothetical protein